MEFTGERMIPSEMRKHNMVNVMQEHLTRYAFVLEYVKDKELVMDLGCGVGYGTKIISCVCDKIIGIDKDNESLEYAKNNFSGHNIEYMVCDVTNPDLSVENKFNAIVAFEFIEHIEAEKFFNFIDQYLNESGMIILSTPINKKGKGIKPNNQFHLFEWTVDECYEILSSKYKNVKMFFQQNVFIRCDNFEYADYMIIVCTK